VGNEQSGRPTTATTAAAAAAAQRSQNADELLMHRLL